MGKGGHCVAVVALHMIRRAHHSGCRMAVGTVSRVVVGTAEPTARSITDAVAAFAHPTGPGLNVDGRDEPGHHDPRRWNAIHRQSSVKAMMLLPRL